VKSLLIIGWKTFDAAEPITIPNSIGPMGTRFATPNTGLGISPLLIGSGWHYPTSASETSGLKSTRFEAQFASDWLQSSLFR